MTLLFRAPAFWICFLILLTGCEKKFDEYYQVPEDLIGTILEVLEEDGGYAQFIKAVELANFDDVLGKTGNFTVFAPDDQAFSEFFSETGYGSLEEIPEEELKGIVFYHIVFWAYSKYMLLYGLNVQDAEIDYSALSFKHPTRYNPPLTIEYDTLGREYDVYHETKFIPVYSSEYFKELDIDASENYEFLYPESSFNGFHADRAEVTEYDVPAQNGWIHRINKVLRPPPNHDDILEQNSEYSIFRELIEKSTYYQYSSSYTTAQNNDGDVDEDGILDSLFLKMNSLFPSGSSPDVENVANNGYQNVLSLFAPTDEALQQFMSERTSGYGSIMDIGEYWINWYLSHYIGTNFWPSQYDRMTSEWEWDLTSSLWDCNIQEGDIHYSAMASNGPFCGLNKYFLPRIFESVAEPIVGDKEYEWFTDMLVFYLVDKLLNEENL
ncbi:MAG: fasciclin domain-containing protein, partial [Bacteroidales bacterium]